MRHLTAVLLLLAGTTGCLAQADPEFVRMYDAAQRQRPRVIASSSRIAPSGEPGTPLVIHGTLLQKDGVTPAANVVVFAYQTDSAGVYHRGGEPGWRLRGWARTDARGKFEFRTIRPGSYPSGRTPAHVHLHADGPQLSRRWLPDLRFRDDPFLTAAQKREEGVCDVTTRNGEQHVDLRLTVTDHGRF